MRKKIFALILSVSFLLASFSGCGNNGAVPESTTEAPSAGEDTTAPDSPSYTIVLEEFPQIVEIHNAEQAAYLADSDPGKIASYVPELPNTERSKPLEVRLNWTVERSNGAKMPTSYRILLGRQSDLSDAAVFFAVFQYLTVKNLYVGSTYYWQVSFEKNGETYQSEIACFQTTGAAPRNIDVEGVTNCRDIGGWKTTDGRTVRQGVAYRSAKLNEGKTVFATHDGIKTLTEALGVRSEIELRVGASELSPNGQSVLGEGVRYYLCGAKGAEMHNMESAIPAVMRIFADEANYPVLFHCSIGTDRTGVIAYLLLALLGVSEADIYRDYCFSNFGCICSSSATSFQIRTPTELKGEYGVETTVKAQAGNTLQEQTRNYLKSLGLTDAELDQIVGLLLE